MGFSDGFMTEKLQEELTAEIGATIKLVMSEMESLASLPPEIAAEPVTFSRTRQAVIRKIWNLSKECVRYGAKTVQRD